MGCHKEFIDLTWELCNGLSIIHSYTMEKDPSLSQILSLPFRSRTRITYELVLKAELIIECVARCFVSVWSCGIQKDLLFILALLKQSYAQYQ